MQDSIKNILIEYQDADFEKRLCMFMTCVELRCQFMEIDASDSFDTDSANNPSLKPIYSIASVIEGIKKIITICFIK